MKKIVEALKPQVDENSKKFISKYLASRFISYDIADDECDAEAEYICKYFQQRYRKPSDHPERREAVKQALIKFYTDCISHWYSKSVTADLDIAIESILSLFPHPELKVKKAQEEK